MNHTMAEADSARVARAHTVLTRLQIPVEDLLRDEWIKEAISMEPCAMAMKGEGCEGCACSAPGAT
jgi:hypothetical protein